MSAAVSEPLRPPQEPEVVLLFGPRSTIWRSGGTWNDWSKRADADEGLPLRLHLQADPVDQEHLPGGEQGRHLYRMGFEYTLSDAVLEELRGAGFGSWITSRLVYPAVRERVRAVVPGLGDAFARIEALEALVEELRGELQAGRRRQPASSGV